MGDFLENVKNYCLGFENIFWYGLAIGHVTIFETDHSNSFYAFHESTFWEISLKTLKITVWVFENIFWYGLAVGHDTIFQLFPPPQSLITFTRSSQVITMISGQLKISGALSAGEGEGQGQGQG